MGTAMGRREIPLLPLPMSYRAATILWMGAGPVGAVDPSHLTMTTIRLIPGTMNLARTRSIMRPLKVQTLASLCVTCSGEQVTRQRWRHGGTGPGLGAFFTPIRLTLSRMPLLFLCGRVCRRISFSRCWTMLRQMIVASGNTTGISCLSHPKMLQVPHVFVFAARPSGIKLSLPENFWVLTTHAQDVSFALNFRQQHPGCMAISLENTLAPLQDL